MLVNWMNYPCFRQTNLIPGIKKTAQGGFSVLNGLKLFGILHGNQGSEIIPALIRTEGDLIGAHRNKHIFVFAIGIIYNTHGIAIV